ncbi:hypothetical protein [Streptomyces sp. NPDC001828]|uniref:hypothetical protein n=1 Tax=Streptomyces sp. NPDC001828 TaxID=3364615 RepID=UPI0036C392F2
MRVGQGQGGDGGGEAQPGVDAALGEQRGQVVEPGPGSGPRLVRSVTAQDEEDRAQLFGGGDGQSP